MDKDPNGLAAAVAAVVMALAAIFGWQVDNDGAAAIGAAVAGVVSLGAILVARRKAWAPDTVAALGPDTVLEPGELPAAP
jgi:uncharacterized protein (DUF697 family)